MPDCNPWVASTVGPGAAVALAFVAGTLIGSFLTVVVSRVPRGETVIFGRSRCPTCAAMVRPRDNVPILGWLILRGRCRDCGTPIPARYPLMEAACGGLSAAVATAQVAAGSGTDPVASAIAWAGHTAVAMTVVAWSLLAARGHGVSRTTVGAAAAVASLAATLVPALHPMAVICPGCGWASFAGWPAGLVASVVGLGVGWTVGAGAGGGPVRASCALVGAAFGWQAAVMAAAAEIAARGLVKRPTAGGLVAAATIAGWQPLAEAWACVCRRLAGG